MSATSRSPLQLGWTGRELVAWWWDGRAAIARGSDGGRVYRELIQQWGWMPPGGAALRIEVELPVGRVVVPAIALPPTSWPAAVRPGVRNAPSVSMEWCTNMARLAARVVGSGHALPVLDSGGGAWRAGWRAVGSDAVAGAVARLAATQPPAVRAVASLGGEIPHRDPVEATDAFFAWLIDELSRTGLRGLRWTAPLKGRRGPEATAARAVAAALTRPDGLVAPLRDDDERWLAPIADALSALRARAGGEPVVAVRLRLGLPEGADDDWPLVMELVDRTDTSRWCTATDVWDATPLALDLAGDERGLRVLEAAIVEANDRIATVLALRPVLTAWTGPGRPGVAGLDVVGASIVLQHVSALQELGIPVHVPGQLLPATARVRGSARPAPAEGSGQFGARALVDWSMVVDGEQVNDATLERAVAAGAALLQVDGRWVRLDPAAAKKALQELLRQRAHHSELDAAGLLKLAAELGPDTAELRAAGRRDRGADDDRAIGGSSEAGLDPDERFDDRAWVDDLLAGLPQTALGEGDVPVGFTATLRPYQRQGLAWLQFLARLGLGGCLADDMGLGKTPTTLAHLAGRPGPHLVVCPLSVVRNWQSEAARFTPGLQVHVHHGTDRLRGDELAAAAGANDLMVSTYGLVARDLDVLATVPWSTLVLDEAQAIKNAHTKSARAVRRIPAAQRLALTGTPIENRLGELWSILDAVNPGLLGSEHRFRDQWAAPIERDGDVERAARLRQVTAPFVLRRTKADKSLVPDLPDKVEQIAWATLTREQAAMYQAVVDGLLRSAEEAEGMQRRGLVIAAITRLKQICNHPAHALGDGSRLAGRSGKLARFDELVVDLLEAGEQALVFSQYRQMGELLQQHLAEKFGLPVPFLHGGVPKARRDRMVESFQDGDGGPLLLVSLRAGGTGLNLTAASRVVHYDRWWNPAVEDQATDRAWRIGQQRSVFVHKLVCQGTLEERIAQVIDEKRALAGLVIGGGGQGETWLTELSTDALRELVVLGSEALG